MKKSLLALAVLGAFAGVASAQSSVTLFGTVDVSGTLRQERRPVTRSSAKRPTASTAASSASAASKTRRRPEGRLQTCSLRHVEPATPAPSQPRKFWNRRSTVSLFSNFGELRLGRDYTPTFWNQTIFDAFGTNGLGSSSNVRQLYGGTPCRTTRSATSCRRTSAASTARPWSPPPKAATGRSTAPAATSVAGSASPPVRSTSPSRTREVRASAHGSQPDSAARVAGRRHAEDLQHRRLVGLRLPEAAWATTTSDNARRRARKSVCSISAVIPFGQSEVHVGYDRSKLDHRSAAASTRSVDQIKATYQYNLSKRTAMYATASRLEQQGRAPASDACRAAVRRRRRPPAATRRASSSACVTSSDRRSPRASSRADRKAAFGRPFSWPLALGSRAIPFDAWRRVCSHGHRVDGGRVLL